VQLTAGLQAVIFDLFGTLVENFSVRDYQEALEAMAAVLEVPAGDFAQAWMDTFAERTTRGSTQTEDDIELMCRQLGAPAGLQQVAAAAQLRRDFTRRQLNPREGALETLRDLRSLGLKLGLISDCTVEVPQLWPETAFAPLFDVAVFSCVERIKKPDPAIYHRACARLSVEPARRLYVGDGSSQELTGAARAGLHPLWLAIPAEAGSDVHRVDAERWSGPAVAALAEVLPTARRWPAATPCWLTGGLPGGRPAVRIL
jgi:putative hydrolase of the HAD superfamily